jgi:glycosyltransferase involved in cell wall biosynthesis
MNILMLGRWVPPPRRPVRGTREYQFARYLARSHRLTLAFITDNPDAAGSISALRSEFGDLEFASVPRGWKSLASAVRLATGESCTLHYFRSEALRARLADRLRSTGYDLVYVSSSTMIQYALGVDPGIPMVVDFGEVDSEWWAQRAVRGVYGAAHFFRTEAARLRAAETAAARRAVRRMVETPEAARIVQSLAPGAPTVVIPNGVDIDGDAAVSRPGKVPTVVFGASLNRQAAVSEILDFCHSIIPAVRARIPHARVVIASRDPLPPGSPGDAVDGLEIVAPIGDVRPLFHRHAVAAAPDGAAFDLRASVLEPMATGVPVVTTSAVRDALRARAGRDLQVADNRLDFALRVVELLESDALRAEMGTQGRGFVQDNFSWEISAARVGELLAGAVKGHAAENGSGPRPIPAQRRG